MVSYRVVLSTFLVFIFIEESKCISVHRQIEMLIKGDLGAWIQWIAIGWCILTIMWLIGFLVLWMSWVRLQSQYDNRAHYLVPLIRQVADKPLFDDKELIEVKKAEDEFASEKEFRKRMKNLPKKETKNAEEHHWRMIIQAIREEQDPKKDKKEKMKELRELFRNSLKNELVKCYTVKDEDKEK